MDETVAIVIVIALAVVVLGVALAVYAQTRQRSRHLRQHFGPEYDRTVGETEDRRAAERELREREQRRDELHIVPLDPTARSLYAEEWRGIQERFVDTPAASVAEADVLVMRVMRDRGYPVDDFDQRAADISVDHPDLVEHFRAAHEMAERSHWQRVDTEELREAVVHYRSLFEALLDDGPTIDLTRRDVGTGTDATAPAGAVPPPPPPSASARRF